MQSPQLGDLCLQGASAKLLAKRALLGPMTEPLFALRKRSTLTSSAVSSIVNRLWNASPASLTRGVRARVRKWTDKPGWFPIQAGPAAGAQLLLPGAPEGFWRQMIAGTYDAFIYEAIAGRRNLRDATCWDIGAHVGYHSLVFAGLGAQVLAIEPNQHNAARLQAHLERNPALARKIRHLAVAVSDQDGEMAFVQSADMMGGSCGSHLAAALPPLHPGVYAGNERLMVPAVRMDSLIDRGERAPDVIKMDVEGAELLALQGARKLLAEKKPVLLIEVHHICLMFYLQQFLLPLGYATRILDEQNASPSRCFIMASAA
jgi:FkbM family methyltransferase